MDSIAHPAGKYKDGGVICLLYTSLAFVCKVCDFYRLSADFLLGRTANRDGAMIDSVTLYDGSTEKGSLRGSIMATLQKKLAVNTTGLPSYSVSESIIAPSRLAVRPSRKSADTR